MPDQGDLALWEQLTDKQRVCLDLLLERKTSKEIAIILGISKWTADQRIASARSILGAQDRDKAAIAYERLKRICDRVAYDSVHIPPRPTFVPSDFPDGDPVDAVRLHDSLSLGIRAETGLRDIPEPFGNIWRHNHSYLWRILIMLGILMASAIVILAGLGIAETLTRLVSG